jgi:hypothetical protein
MTEQSKAGEVSQFISLSGRRSRRDGPGIVIKKRGTLLSWSVDLGANNNGAKRRFHFLKSYCQGRICENLSKKGLKNKKDGVIGTEVTHLVANQIGAKLRTHVGVDAELAVTWQPNRRQLYWRQAWCHDHWCHAWHQYNWRQTPVLNPPQPLFLSDSVSFSSYGTNSSGALNSGPHTLVLPCVVIASQFFAIWLFFVKNSRLHSWAT